LVIVYDPLIKIVLGRDVYHCWQGSDKFIYLAPMTAEEQGNM